jgi:preprotein translocase subunit SecA
MSVFTKILRAGEGRKVRALQALVPDINALEPEIEPLSDAELRGRTNDLRTRVDRAVADGTPVAEALNDVLIEAFAVTREAARFCSQSCTSLLMRPTSRPRKRWT